MRFHVDVQIHSKYSRATARNADLENMALWGLKKGVTVVGTGDFTHPAWLSEIKEKLVPAEPGLFRLRDDLESEVTRQAPAACAGPVRFMLEVEISTIYKKGDKVRKIHHLIFVPNIDAADRLVTSLSRIGNLASDGRPILGLDSRDLLEITLATGPHSYLIPAHIWTPWFAVLGSKSGFDSIEECYGDLAKHIFAAETGLSSDPEMNWRISSLDRYRLVSNSDAHSPPKIGRESTTYDCALDYFAMLDALRTGEGFVGTVEFFPEEGKYHMDGHRKCAVRLTPEETRAHGGKCPVCGGPITVGVLHRVDELSDRTEAAVSPPPKAGKTLSLVPLPEILSEIKGVGPNSKAVAKTYEHLLAQLGPELSILETVPLEDIAGAESPVLAEAVSRLRRGEVIRDSGYDGEYGVIRLFDEDELRRHRAGGVLFDLPPTAAKGNGARRREASRRRNGSKDAEKEPGAEDPEGRPTGETAALAGLDDAQRRAVETIHGPLVIAAGPGSGKTRTLTRRIARLVADCGVPPESCLAITFTRRAPAEMSARLASLVPSASDRISIHTFHSLGLSILREHADAAGLRPGFRVASEDEREAALAAAMDLPHRRAGALLRAISLAKRTASPGGDDAMETYRRVMAERNWVDFDDLVGLPLRTLERDGALRTLYRDRYRYISVDEFQDLDAQQYRLVKALASTDANLCVIGDPDQAIYGFRGADASCFRRFTEDYPSAAAIRLDRNYRSSGTIVSASSQVIAPGADDGSGAAVRDMLDRVTVHAARTERAEAEFVVQTIEEMIGGHSFFSIDSGRGADGAGADLSFADFAVLYRTDAQSEVLAEALARSGMPFGKHSHTSLANQPAVQALLRRLEDGAGALPDRLEQAAKLLAEEAEAPDAAAVHGARRHLTVLAERCADPAELADAVALAAEADFWDPRADRVSLLTLHAAKGLEFPVVFITGLEDGILPLYWGRRDDVAVEEERRLFYVGMTRARDRLVLSRAEKRQWRGAVRELAPSPFLSDIEIQLLEHSRMAALATKAPERQMELF